MKIKKGERKVEERGYRARHDCSLAWLEAEWNFSEGGLARLKGSGFKKGCVLLYILHFLWILEYSYCVLERGRRSCWDLLHVQTLSSGSFILLMLMCEWYPGHSIEPPEGHSGHFEYIFAICTCLDGAQIHVIFNFQDHSLALTLCGSL